MLPEGWQRSTLGKIGKWSGGGTPSKSNDSFWKDGTIPWVSPKDMKFRLINDAEDYITEEAVSASSTKLYPAKSVLIVTRSGILRKQVPVAIATRAIAVNQDIKVFNPNKKIDSTYLANYLWANNKRLLFNCVKEGTTVESIETDALLGFPITLPPLSEQKSISKVISVWSQAVEITEKLICNSKAQKKALMQQLLTGKKRLPGSGKKWQQLRASEIFKAVSQKNQGNEALLSVTQDKGVVFRSEQDRKVAMPEGSINGYKLVVPGNFIISLRSFQGGLEYSTIKGLVSPAYTVLASIKNISHEYYQQYFKSYDFIGRLAVAVIGIRDGKQISYSDFSFIKLPCPPFEEQEKIAKILNTADLEIRNLQTQLEKLKQEKAALMQQLLTGKRRVKV